jgi:hypothetical protein
LIVVSKSQVRMLKVNVEQQLAFTFCLMLVGSSKFTPKTGSHSKLFREHLHAPHVHPILIRARSELICKSFR